MQKNYNTPFKITKNIGNNVFCFNESEKSKIHIPSLIKVNNKLFKKNISNYLKISNKTAFREKKN
jgi:hypothetical protein